MAKIVITTARSTVKRFVTVQETVTEWFSKQMSLLR